MITRRQNPFQYVVGLVLALAVVVGCSEDAEEGNTGPDIPEAFGPAGDAAAAVGDVADKFFRANAAAFQSVGVFGPLIGGALSLAPSTSGLARSSGFAQSCLSETLVGTTFDFDFSQNAYVQSQLGGAPTDGMRFLLFNVDAQGNPQQGSPLGQIDIVCTGQLPSIDVNIAIVVADVTVLSMNVGGGIDPVGGSFNLFANGLLRAPDGSSTLTFGDMGASSAGGIIGGTQYGSSFDFNIAPSEQIFAMFGRTEIGDGTFIVFANVQKGFSDFEWSFMLELFGQQDGSVTGRVDLVSRGPNGTFACVSGNFENPSIDDASACEEPGAAAIDGVDSDQRGAVAAAYRDMRSMWAALDSILRTGLDIVVASVSVG